MAGVKLDAIAQEQALVPGTELEIEYNLITGSSYLVALWLNDVEPKLEAEEPLWQYLGYSWNPDSTTIIFKMRLREYQMDMATQEIILLDPVTLEPIGEPRTMYYASAGFMVAAIALGSAAAAGFSWLIVREVRQIKVAEAERTKAILNDEDLSPAQKVTAINGKGGILEDAAAAAGGTFAVAVMAALAYIIFGRKKL